MRVLITGAGGQLGRDCAEAFARRGHGVFAADRAALDVSDGAVVERFFRDRRFDAVVHCAAYTAVDRAEDEKERCFAVNAAGSAHIARGCAEQGARLLYISTDYVFDGSGERPWPVDAPCRPLSVYGESKRQGEEAVRAGLRQHFIVRSSWIFGAQGHNFVKTILRLAREGQALRVVDDQIGAPTYTRDLAELLCLLAESDAYGTYHAATGFEALWGYLHLAGEQQRLKTLFDKITALEVN